MPNLIKQLFAAGVFAVAASALCAAPAMAEEGAKAVKTKAAKPAKAKAKKAREEHPKAVDVLGKNGDPEHDEPDIADTKVTDFSCELGNKVTIYQNENDEAHIALRWKKRLHRLTRVDTTTGAKRFENRLFGLVWIGIPAKGMLLDSKLNRQLANECKNAEQEKSAQTETTQTQG